ncbi:MAG: hypothetical protein RLP11_21825 [Marinoscillum sp.]|uniref:hypothetical protein n=2 Tax=Marinoscillum sp. TaxID=2024838 RepID=UPI0032FF8749
MRRLFIFVCIFLMAYQWSTAQAQDIYRKYDIYRSPFRVLANKIGWTISTGYGATNYKHDLAGFYFYQDGETQLILSKQNELGPVFSGYQQWMSNPTPGEEVNLDDVFDVPYDYLENPVNNPLLKNRQFIGDADTLGLSFSSIASTVPVMVSAHYDFQKFRIGVGFQYEQHYMTPLKPSVYQEVIRPYEPDFKQTHYLKYFGMMGYEFYEFWDYTFVLEVQLGRAKPGKEINTSAIGIGQNFYTNIGVNIEQNLSEYFRVVIRPSYDIKSYVVNLPDASSIRHTNSAFMIQVGISINIPEIPRSPMASDHVQLKHVITDPASGRLMEVRGQPMWKKQNPKVGENHRRLWRYKLKNRRKIDPY